MTTGMDKTISVRVERRYKHPKYGKYLSAHKKYLAHDEDGQVGVGDTVIISETRPISKRKRFRLLEVVRKAKMVGESAAPTGGGAE
jgi:small subunit ribosomal protein S17